MSDESNLSFADLGLPDHLLQSLKAVGYETPSPIQAQTIPHVMNGDDVLGQAQTGTGKTAAFALPLVANIDLSKKKPQALVLAPTRELAIQVAEAFQKYASHRKGFHVMPIYGGENYSGQMRGLKRGVHVVVGTPGRVMDHMRRGTLDLSDLQTLVLDEADEMLRMGFIEDVEWILEQTPEHRQIALFSATMPKEIKRIATSYLHEPKEVTIKVKTQTASTIRQRVWMVSGVRKLEALTRILEVEPFDGVIIFVRTKHATEELAEKLQARGYAAVALNGDMPQQARARTVTSLKNGHIDILVATDVAARGLDVERISHVINFDIPQDTEAYVHRIGRTGRAGRSGEAILFAAPRERRMLRAIENATNKKIEQMHLPTTKDVNEVRVTRFKDRISEMLEDDAGLSVFRELLEEYQNEKNVPAIEVAAALAKLVQGKEPLFISEQKQEKGARGERGDRAGRHDRGERGERGDRDRANRDRPNKRRSERNSDGDSAPSFVPNEEMEVYRVAVGRDDGVTPKHIVGAIANEADIDSRYIGEIEIQGKQTLVELPAGMPKEVFRHLQKAWVLGKPMKLSRLKDKGAPKKNKTKRKSNAGADKRKPSDDRRKSSDKSGKKSKQLKAKRRTKRD